MTIETKGLDPQTDWWPIEVVSRITRRNPALIRRWIATRDPRLPAGSYVKGAAWPYPWLLSPDACIALASETNIPRRRVSADAFRPAEVA